MLIPALPPNEAERLASLRRMALLGTPDEAAFDRITRTAQRLFAVPIALISLVDLNRQWFKSCIGLPVRETSRDVSFCGHAILGRELFIIPDATQDPRFADNPLVIGEAEIRFYAGKVIRNAEGHAIGTLCLIDRVPRTFSAADRQALNDLGAWAEMALLARELGATQQQLIDELDAARLAGLVDPLLNIWNRRAIFDLLHREVQRGLRERSPVSVLMVDFDHFKQINDRHGHAAGDIVLRESCMRIRGALRSYDCLGRYGGEEFLIVLPGTSVDEAVAIAERVCAEIADAPISIVGGSVPVTASIGAGSLAAEADGVDGVGDAANAVERLLAEADRAVYQAKSSGRNCVRFGA